MLQARMLKEIGILTKEPPPGISAWPREGKITEIEARIQGPEGTPYEKGTFHLEVLIPDRYPFEPPKVKFLTPIYHPNIDSGGRICLDTLNMPPKGVWRPALNVSTVLTSVQQLMAEPNPEDPLMTDINEVFVHNKALFLRNAVEMTLKHASQDRIDASDLSSTSSATSTTTPTEKEDDVKRHRKESNKEEEAAAAVEVKKKEEVKSTLSSNNKKSSSLASLSGKKRTTSSTSSSSSSSSGTTTTTATTTKEEGEPTKKARLIPKAKR